MRKRKVEIARYRGRRGVGKERLQWVLAGLLALAGIVLIAVRAWGMRFSGFLLVGLAALLVLARLLDRWAERSEKGLWCRRAFQSAVALVLVPLLVIEAYVIHFGRSDRSALPADAVIVLGAGVNGTEPSLSLRTRLDAALDYLEDNPDVPVVLTGGKGYGEEISEAQCMYDWLTARGVDPERLILEERAGNTAENFAFSRELLEERGIDPDGNLVAVVTNDFHIARSRLIAAKQGYGHAFGVPAKLPWVHLEINYYLREAFAVVKTVLFD